MRAAAGEPRLRPDASGLPVARSPRSLPSGPRLLLPFPAGAPRIYRTDHDGTLKERHRFAALVKPLLARGYEVTDVVVDADGTPAYVLDRIG